MKYLLLLLLSCPVMASYNMTIQEVYPGVYMSESGVIIGTQDCPLRGYTDVTLYDGYFAFAAEEHRIVNGEIQTINIGGSCVITGTIGILNAINDHPIYNDEMLYLYNVRLFKNMIDTGSRVDAKLRLIDGCFSVDELVSSF